MPSLSKRHHLNSTAFLFHTFNNRVVKHILTVTHVPQVIPHFTHNKNTYESNLQQFHKPINSAITESTESHARLCGSAFQAQAALRFVQFFICFTSDFISVIRETGFVWRVNQLCCDILPEWIYGLENYLFQQCLSSFITQSLHIKKIK